MIGTKFFHGQGLGNQLWVYAVVRSIAERKGLDFAFVSPENFKGRAFLNLVMDSRLGNSAPAKEGDFAQTYVEEIIRHPESKADISPWDPKLHDVSDDTYVLGTMQSEKYFANFKDAVAGWFQVPGRSNDTCVISLRGGEYRNMPDVFLPRSYFENAISKIREIDPAVKFVVVSDDRALALEYFPDFPVVSSGGVKRFWRWYKHPKSEKIGRDFAAIQHARYLILSNSSFSWWGAFTNVSAEKVIAPKYWARFNISDGYWSNGDSLTEGWDWLDRNGLFYSFEECAKDLAEYRKQSGRN